MPATFPTDDPRLAPLLDRWNELRDSAGGEPPASEVTTDPDLLPALARAIADILFAEGALGGAGPDPEPAEGVAGRFEVFGKAFPGGMGDVYRARDVEMGGRVVAYKVMKPGRHGSPWLVGQFYREAMITDAVRQPGVVPIYARARDDSGRPAYAMEFVEGETLKRATARLDGGPGLAGEAAALLRRFADACRIVGVAHDRGYVHADLSPRNLMVVEAGESARVVDWGSALRVDDGDDSRPARPVTPGFSDPALAPGDPPRPASDVFALGVCLGGIVARLASIDGPVLAGRSRSGALRALGAIAARAAAATPADRYPTAAAIADDLQLFLAAQRPLADRAEPLGERSWRWASRHKVAVTSAAALLLLAAISLTLLNSALVHAVRKEREARDSRELALWSRVAATLATCEMLASADPDLIQGDASETARLILHVVESKGRNPDAAEAVLGLFQDIQIFKQSNKSNTQKERRRIIERRLDSGREVLETLIREYPERASLYRIQLARSYYALGAMRFGKVPSAGELMTSMAKYLGNPGEERPERPDYEAVLVLMDKAMETLPPPSASLGEDARVSETRCDICLIRMAVFIVLTRFTEGLQALESAIATMSGPVQSYLIGLRPTVRMAAEMEQQHLPWSGSKNPDHAKAVRMADYLAVYEGVSDSAVFNAACVLALASRDEAAAPAERRVRADRAVSYLIRAADRDYFREHNATPPPDRNTVRELRTDSALDPLRERPDFLALIGRYRDVP